VKKTLAIGSGLLLALTTLNAESWEIRLSTVSGELMSAAAELEAGKTQTLLETPATGYFIITQAGAAYAKISGSTFGSIPAGSFEPGLAIPQNEVISCTNSSPYADTCFVTGVLSKR